MCANFKLIQAASVPNQRSWTDLRATALIVVVVSLIYGTRLTVQPLIGEETRWATAAREMLDTGDWVVTRQQGQPFPERPPMTTWLMAIAGRVRGEVDPIAVRLPSVIAIVLTCLLIYGYTRNFVASSTALIAALVYATSAQVLQIGRRGESEAAFALFVSASLLLWHLAYVRRYRPIFVWTIGFAFAALAALVKGPQAPAYFGAITVAYLLANRDWRYLVRWQTVAGGLVFIAIIAAWQIPFYRATDWSSVRAIWTGLAGDRFRLGGMLKHSLTYPVETFGCLLPWSPMLFALMFRSVRERLRMKSDVALFLLIAIAVAYPTVWLASRARGRYFMPLYPVVAVLIAVLIECCSQAPVASVPYRLWRRFLLSSAAVIGLIGTLVAANALLPGRWTVTFYQPPSFAILYGAIGVVAACVIWRFNYVQLGRPLIPVIVLSGVAGLSAAGIVVNVNAARWSDPTSSIAELSERIPPGERLASFSEIEHRFAYYYGKPIVQLPWPRTVADLSEDVNYFVFIRRWDDTAEVHLAGRGRTYYATPGTLPFEWEEITTLCPDRQVDTPTAISVVLGKVTRPLHATISDVSKPQSALANRSTTLMR